MWREYWIGLKRINLVETLLLLEAEQGSTRVSLEEVEDSTVKEKLDWIKMATCIMDDEKEGKKSRTKGVSFLEKEGVSWKPCSNGFPGYSASDTTGEIRNDKTMMLLSQFKKKDGHPYVSLWLNSRSVVIPVNRLVAFAYLPRQPGKDSVRHKDDNKMNNAFENLEWCKRTRTYSSQ